MTLTVKLAREEQERLDVIVAALRSGNQSDAIRALINEKFEQLQANLTLVERRGGHPKHLLHSGSNLSERANRKAAVAEILVKKARNRAK